MQPDSYSENIGAHQINSIQDVNRLIADEDFNNSIPSILDFVDPHEELNSAQKKSGKDKKRKVAQKESFRMRKQRSDLYKNLSDNQLDAVLEYLFKNYHEERLINLFNAVEFAKQIKILTDMLDLAFKADLISYTKEVVNIRRKIAKGYVKSAESMEEAENYALSGDYMKTVLYLNKNPHKITAFLNSFKSNPDLINNILKELMKWVPRGEYLTH